MHALMVPRKAFSLLVAVLAAMLLCNEALPQDTPPESAIGGQCLLQSAAIQSQQLMAGFGDVARLEDEMEEGVAAPAAVIGESADIGAVTGSGHQEAEGARLAAAAEEFAGVGLRQVVGAPSPSPSQSPSPPGEIIGGELDMPTSDKPIPSPKPAAKKEEQKAQWRGVDAGSVSLTCMLFLLLLVLIYTLISRPDQVRQIGAKPRLDVIDKIFLKHKNAKFALDWEIAFRAAVAMTILAIPFFIPDSYTEEYMPNLHYFIEEGWYSKYALACFLFSYYLDLGNTVNLAITTIAGTWLAVLGVWSLFGFMPDSVTPDSPPHHLHAGFAYAGCFTWLVLWLNLPLNSQIFCLASFAFYLMDWMNPEGNKKYAKNFGIDFHGAATKELVNAIIGSSLAVIAMCLPRPVLASRKAVVGANNIVDTLALAWRDLTSFCCAATEEEMNAFEEAGIQRSLREVFNTVNDLEGNLHVAWWECMGIGGTQRQRAMLYSLERLLVISYDRILSTFSICLIEKTPSSLTQAVRRQIDSVTSEASNILIEGLMAVADTRVTAERRRRLLDRVAATREAVRQLTRAFGDAKQALRPRPEVLDPNLLSEHSFCLTVCAFGNGAADWGQRLADGTLRHMDDGGPLGLGCLANMFDANVLFDWSSASWSLKTWIALAASFVMGYYGTIDGWEFTKPHNAAISGTLAVLMSKGASTGVSKNLSRLQGVILGTAVGSLAYSILGHQCSWAGMASLVIANFLWMNFGFFLYHNSDANSYLGFLLAYCGSKGMVDRCGSKTSVHFGQTVMDLLMTIIFMTVVDMIFQRDTAAHMAHQAFNKAWETIKISIDELLDPKYPTIQFHGNEISAQLADAKMYGDMASAEARWMRTPWRSKTFDEAVASATRIRYVLTGMKCAMAGGTVAKDKPATLLALLRLDGFESLAKRPIFRMEQCEQLLVILRQETEGRLEAYLKVETEIRRDFSMVFGEHLTKVCAAANADPQLKAPEATESLETQPSARQSYLLGALSALTQEAWYLQSRIILQG